MDFLASLSKSPSRSKSPAPPKPSRFRRHPPPELQLAPPTALTASASSSNLLSVAAASIAPAASASTSNLRAPSPSPERDKDPKRDKGKRLGMLAQPLSFHLPRAKSPKPEQKSAPPLASRFSKSSSSIPDPSANTASLQPLPDQPADASLSPIPATPSTTSVSSASTSTTNLAPSVPARSPLRGTPRSVASFTSLLHHYVPTPTAPDSTLGLGLGLAAGIGSSAGWSQLMPPPPSPPSVYSPVRSIFQPSERRASAEGHRVRRSASMRADRLRSTSASGETAQTDGNGSVPRSKRLDGLRMPSTRVRSASISSPILYEDGAHEGDTTQPNIPHRTSVDRTRRSTDTAGRPTSPPPRTALSPRPSTSRRYTTTNTNTTPHASATSLPTRVRDSGVAVDKDLPPPVPPKLHLRMQSEFTLGPEFGITPGSESGESSGFETAASHTAHLHPSTGRPGTSASANTNMAGVFIALPTPTAESASTMTSATSQVSLLLDSPPRSKLQPDEGDPRPSTSSLLPPSVSGASTPGSSSALPKTAKRTHALLELLSSERAYASDLALIRDIYLPLARGAPSSFPLPPSASSLMFQSTASMPTHRPNGATFVGKKPARNGSIPVAPPASGSLDDPPMTEQDVKVVFGNIEELAAFADELADQLEVALGNAIPGGEGEDQVGELFLELASKMTPMYLTYITRHPAAVARYTTLTTNPTPAMAHYLSTTRAMTSSITHAWDIPSLIIKPLQRLLKYPLILQTILDDTPTSMGHKDRAALSLAKDKMEEVARQVNEGRRRYEVVKNVLESGKSPPGAGKITSVGRMKTFRGRPSAVGTEDLVILERRVKDGAAAANAMAEHVLAWANSLTEGAVKLLAWSKAFARVVDLDVVLGGDPQGGSEAVRAFTAVAQSLDDLSRELAAVIKEELLAQLSRLVRTTREPLLLLSHMHVLASAHHNLVNAPYSKSRPAALLEASQAYVALAAQLREELPRYVDMFERAFGIVVLRLSGWQARFFQEAERRWKEFWLALNVEESEVGAGESAAVETVRIWWSRWEATARQTAGMAILSPNKRVYRPQPQPNTPSSADSASWDHIPPHPPYAQSGGSGQASALSLADQSSAASSSKGVYGHGRAVSNEYPPAVARERSGASLAPRVQSDPAPDRLFPKGKKANKGSNLRRMTDQFFGGTPGPNSLDSPEPTRSSSRASGSGGPRGSTHSGSSRMVQQHVLYAAAAIHPFDPETDATHLGLPFLTLRIGDTLEILVEAGHPSEHSNLPIKYDDAPDCMLAARSEDGVEGWALASYLMPLT
ncbi:hypothetical protein FRC10_009204 [Ceratobasidium sp. 414]|nr:hypothetical protein FRC10_009204 [Ceratobasidium sp. 414]